MQCAAQTSPDGRTDNLTQWFVMRDLKRCNAKQPAYKQLAEAGFKVFTPMTQKIVHRGGLTKRCDVPYVSDLLFVCSNRRDLDPIVARTDTLQYRFVKGAPHCSPLVVADADMNRFIAAVELSDAVRYYTPDEITPDMYGRTALIVTDGALDGCQCRLLKVRGARKKRVLVELPGLLIAALELSPAYLRLLP